MLHAKDLEWSKEHLTAEAATTEEKRSATSAIEPPNKQVVRPKKVI